MTKEKRNLEIALMLGFKESNAYKIDELGYYQCVEGYSTLWKNNLDEQAIEYQSDKNAFAIKDLQFHSDWKWLMEAVDFIEKLDLTDEHYSWEDDEGKTRNNFVCLSVEMERDRCFIFEELELDPPHCVVQYVGENKLDATFICVSDFAKIFNERKNEKTKN